MHANTGSTGNADVPVEELPTERDGSHGDKVYSHPAFGHIHASRVSSTQPMNLLGSDFPHTHFVTITIAEAELVRSGLSYDREFSGKQLITVALSEAQWATFVSSLNAGGTPCTLERVMGETRPSIPRRKKEEVAKSEVRAKISTLLADIDKTIANVNGELGAGLSDRKRSAILEHLSHLRSTVNSGLPWVAQMFAEEMETTVERAKIEIHAHMAHQVQRAGLAALSATGAGPLLIEEGERAADPAVIAEADRLVELCGLEGAIREAKFRADEPRQSGELRHTRWFRDRVLAELQRRWMRADRP